MNRREFLAGSAALAAAGMHVASAADGNATRPPNLAFKELEEVPFLSGGGRVWCFSNRGHSQMESHVFVSPEGKVLVIDGGFYDDAAFLRQFLLSIGGKVDYWFITHAHEDHYGALVKMYENGPVEGLEIGELLFSFPERAWMEKYERECIPHLARLFDKFLPKLDSKTTRGDCSVGRKVTFGSWSFEILNDFLLCPNNPINNSSICLTVNAGGKRWLVTGDLGVQGGKRVAAALGERLRHDIVFLAHHGQNGVEKDFYAEVKPDMAVWPTPDWLWENRAWKQTPGSGPWKTNYTKCWMQELGVKRNYVLSRDVVFV